jgi:hypothetical protein
MTPLTTGQEQVKKLKAEARQHEQDARDSFERCDTDGFLSQAASAISAQEKRLQAEIVSNGGTWWFPILVDAETGAWVPSRLTETRYGLAWALLGADDNFSGEFITAFPKREATMSKKGYREARGLYPDKAKIFDWYSVGAVQTMPTGTPPLEMINNKGEA